MDPAQLAQIANLLERRKSRVLAAILGTKESEIDELVPPAISRRLRKVVLDEVNEYHSMVLDVLSSFDSEDHVVLNDYWLERIAQIHEVVVGANGSG